MTPHEHLLKEWLESDADAVFRRFAGRGPHVRHDGAWPDTRILYVPGPRPDRVLLLAHVDTVWDGHPTYPVPVHLAEGVFSSTRDDLGIGADDRAGCALLWALADLGHSILLTSGEERGCLASRWIAEERTDLLDELNAHHFMVQFDRQGCGQFKCYDVGTDAFRAYVQTATGFGEPDRLRGTDITVLARRVCGVNLSVGYHHEHTPQETLVVAEWERTLRTARAWLGSGELPEFRR